MEKLKFKIKHNQAFNSLRYYTQRIRTSNHTVQARAFKFTDVISRDRGADPQSSDDGFSEKNN